MIRLQSEVSIVQMFPRWSNWRWVVGWPELIGGRSVDRFFLWLRAGGFSGFLFSLSLFLCVCFCVCVRECWNGCRSCIVVGGLRTVRWWMAFVTWFLSNTDWPRRRWKCGILGPGGADEADHVYVFQYLFARWRRFFPLFFPLTASLKINTEKKWNETKRNEMKAPAVHGSHFNLHVIRAVVMHSRRRRRHGPTTIRSREVGIHTHAHTHTHRPPNSNEN